MLVNQDNILLIYHAPKLKNYTPPDDNFSPKSLKNKTFQPVWLHDIFSYKYSVTQTAL